VSVPHRNEVSKVGSQDEIREVIPNINVARNPNIARIKNLELLRDNKIMFPHSKSKQEFEIEKMKLIKLHEESALKALIAKSHELMN
jgi:hypothetical protein